MKTLPQKALLILMSLLIFSCSEEEALPVNADFELEIFNNDFSVPVEVILFNATKGAEDYLWTFEGGVPQVSTQRNPGVITYNAKSVLFFLLISNVLILKDNKISPETLFYAALKSN